MWPSLLRNCSFIRKPWISPTTLPPEQFRRGYGYLADQLSQASLSVAANIAEGNGRFTTADRRNFFGIARGSVQECVPLLELARRRELIDLPTYERLKADLEEIARMLSGLINGLGEEKFLIGWLRPPRRHALHPSLGELAKVAQRVKVDRQ